MESIRSCALCSLCSTSEARGKHKRSTSGAPGEHEPSTGEARAEHQESTSGAPGEHERSTWRATRARLRRCSIPGWTCSVFMLPKSNAVPSRRLPTHSRVVCELVKCPISKDLFSASRLQKREHAATLTVWSLEYRAPGAPRLVLSFREPGALREHLRIRIRGFAKRIRRLMPRASSLARGCPPCDAGTPANPEYRC